MALNELDSIIDKLKSQGKMSFLPTATEAQIKNFELKQDVILPSKYKEWLLFSDGGECYLPAGVQLYGIAQKPLIDISDNDRPNANYIVIGRLASGEPIICEKNAEQISIYNHEAGKIEDGESLLDFFAFLRNLDEILGIGE